VKAEVDEGYRGLGNVFPDQVSALPRKPAAASTTPPITALSPLWSPTAPPAGPPTVHKPSTELVRARPAL
jgi:hypothetical protein